ncbi:MULTISPECIES: glucose-1-phosphate cytidylyltransferase [Bacillaceae]|uniref:glucose-1-phosphate cytidylyltransferase n=1 Tax=Bacillaceae TaxID=186817 RepID=UPI002FFF3E46
MKVVILAGGFGTRISEESRLKPKPMIEIGEKPILWHIMNIYSHYGFHDFIICLGYKGDQIKKYFSDYILSNADVTFHLQEQKISIHQQNVEPWNVTLVDTGLHTMTGGRIKRIQKYIGNSPFMLTYGDGLSDINIQQLVDTHHAQGKIVTVTAVQPTGRFGILNISEDGTVSEFMEKPKGDGSWVNGGFFVLQPEIFDYITGDDVVLEKEPLETLAKKGQLVAYMHAGFWHPMDTLRDKNHLNDLWDSNQAPWKKVNDQSE